MTNLPPSNFTLISARFKDIIQNEKDFDKTGLPSSYSIRRKTYTLIDGSKFYITEYIKDGKIDIYFYDLFRCNGAEDHIRFHSESHPDKKDQTVTEPFHVHNQEVNNPNKKRLPNYEVRELIQIFEWLRFTFIYNKLI